MRGCRRHRGRERGSERASELGRQPALPGGRERSEQWTHLGRGERERETERVCERQRREIERRRMRRSSRRRRRSAERSDRPGLESRKKGGRSGCRPERLGKPAQNSISVHICCPSLILSCTFRTLGIQLLCFLQVNRPLQRDGSVGKRRFSHCSHSQSCCDFPAALSVLARCLQPTDKKHHSFLCPVQVYIDIM